MTIAIFDRPEKDIRIIKKQGVFYEEDGIVKFNHGDSDSPVSDEVFDFLWGNSYVHRISKKIIKKTNSNEYLDGLLHRFHGRVWAEKVS